MSKPPFKPLMMADVLAAEGSSGLRVASTFSGAGGSCTGYRLAGYSVIWANEFEPTAADTYKENAQVGCVLDRRDIRTVRGEEILEAAGLKLGELDLFDGSPPCQSFSTAGKREKGWGKSIAHADGTTQRSDDLFEEYIRLVREVQPKVFVAENVTGLVKGTAKGYFKRLLVWMREAGYNVECRIVDARWLGVPQARQRAIFIGVRNDIAAALGEVERYPRPAPWCYSVADACSWISGEIYERNYCDMVHDSAGTSPTIQSSLQQRIGPVAGVESHPKTDDPVDMEIKTLGKSALRAWMETKVGGSHPKHFSTQRVAGDAPSPTIASFQCSPSAHGICHPYEPRRFTILEVKRLCSFPDDFKMLGKFEQRWARLGNAVPPLMMKAVAEAIRDNILIPYSRLAR